MAKTKRSRDDGETYDSDGGFVSNDDGNAPRSKKSKKVASKPSSGGDEQFWPLSSGRTPRRVNIIDFKSNKLVNIREFYEKDEVYLPGKKGISLTIDQYKALLRSIPDINAALKEEGIDVGESPLDEEAKPAERKPKAKTEKANIEETSEEEEDEE